MTLYEIVKSLQNAQGNLNKQAILMQHKDNHHLRQFMKATYDPSLNYYQKKCPNPSYNHPEDVCDELTIPIIQTVVEQLAERKVTGNAAKKFLEARMSLLTKEGQELLKLMIDRSIGASVGDTMVLKTWPDLYFSVPYQRCSLLDAKAKEKFSKLPLMYVQEKCDGSFLYLVKEVGKPAEAITRAGSKYPKEFADKLSLGVTDNVVLIGELLVYEDVSSHGDWVVLDRQTGNGILNSILKGCEVDNDKYRFKMTAWDFLTVDEFKAGKSKYGYAYRLDDLDKIEAPNVYILKTVGVNYLEDAYKIYSEFTSLGKEGAVLKTHDFLWKDGTSKDCVKLKVEFEIDLKITGVVEGTGKASGMVGALQLSSSCGKLVTDVGTGFSDEMRKVFWMHKHDMFGKIVAIKANDIIGKRGSDTFSCFLPVFLEERLDKTEANSYEECAAILNAAKGLK